MASPYSVLGKGSYGAVFSPALTNQENAGPVSYPPNAWVSKIFFQENNMNKAVSESERVSNLMNNASSYSVHPHTARRVRELDPALRNSVWENPNNANNNNVVHSVRLPHLGVSIHDIVKKFERGDMASRTAFRETDISVILGQLRKCIAQLARLQEREYIHGDVRESNIMFNPNTGAITIIDFDWLYPYNDFLEKYSDSFGFYSNPPETFLPFMPYRRHRSEPERYWIVNASDVWAQQSGKQFNYFYDVMNLPTPDDVAGLVVDSVPMNKAALNRGRPDERSLLTVSFPSFDSYGFAMTMANLFTIVYPSYLKKVDDGIRDGLIRSLGQRITRHGVAYSDAELVVIADTLVDVATLFKDMTWIDVTNRIGAREASQRMSQIVEQYEDRIRAAVAPPAPVAAPAAPVAASAALSGNALRDALFSNQGNKRRKRKPRMGANTRKAVARAASAASLAPSAPAVSKGGRRARTRRARRMQ